MKYQFDSDADLLSFLNENLLSTIETAEVLGVSKVRVGHLVKTGKLQPAKDQPKIFLKSVVLDKKKELEELRKKYRPYDE
ncbi:helix-turn-helix domain-containing protein [Virgibacillus pantothenticus]|uniref:DNA-binding protein n=1 Tax=Virgibacillus pantothenticus TaxID=1473 RepID=A0A0L0QME4_VIRPA|nr:helix-turn-helix domain-containing protein [Virgibacillus pantothenticus]KNE19679.1 DNA-binding protein [Virgibacillus pantothenticus]MED3739242.1 helix-turn-helix domain-containing protein [Virgibacillus pantothenticus]QTY14791.1 helix-turn-helix domain-containing protein [Virgibacillus pantothenticus]SIT17560.1 transcriptional regulator, AlpA family [Virgibacillus pantothenticus]